MLAEHPLEQNLAIADPDETNLDTDHNSRFLDTVADSLGEDSLAKTQDRAFDDSVGPGPIDEGCCRSDLEFPAYFPGQIELDFPAQWQGPVLEDRDRDLPDSDGKLVATGVTATGQCQRQCKQNSSGPHQDSSSCFSSLSCESSRCNFSRRSIASFASGVSGQSRRIFLR